MKICKDTKFVLYGAGEIGQKSCLALKKSGYSVLGAVDAHKQGEHIIEGIVTYKFDTASFEVHKEEVVVIICLANGMIHKEVAEIDILFFFRCVIQYRIAVRGN